MRFDFIKREFQKAIQQGNMEGAKIYAENAIRNKNQALNFRRMASRVDAVAQRVQTALTTKKVTHSMAGVVQSMESAMKSMNLEQVFVIISRWSKVYKSHRLTFDSDLKISTLMDKFEQQFESLDVQTNVMGDAMQSTTTMTTPQNQVDQLMQEVADEAGIELNMNLPQAQGGTVGVATASHEQVIYFPLDLLHFNLSFTQTLCFQGRIVAAFGKVETRIK